MEVCLRTGDAGGDASDLLEDPDLISYLWLLPYLRLAPELASVVDRGDGIGVGYVLGALDTVAFDVAAETGWWPEARARFPLDVAPADSLDGLLVHLLHHRGAPDADLVTRYPSHLHIDLLPEVQGRGLGRAMIDRLLGQLTDRGSPGVHLGTSPANTRAVAFYRHLGFDEWGRDSGGSVVFVRSLR
ncbi:MAG: GNAT family N-acetyltransferase [Acidimicrobiia bacterium]|nr:GNAT family N-acetyltransferase [Microthrixaceae bacterium]MCB9400472.1 GNAT family N-acetyltransferase [Microthrixaceae bacterium]MCC6184253.1 GNAT family N-acetyltransferase [Microthrixaceae bacterium]RTL05780.1 MAG: GNAT family N-acetyltransferase [Acidimicrobiia bacterium]